MLKVWESSGIRSILLRRVYYEFEKPVFLSPQNLDLCEWRIRCSASR